MPFRTQLFVERCAACDEAARRVCPRCRAPVCPAHTCEPYGCCEVCATDIYFAVSKAGRAQMLGGSAVAAVSTAGLYALYALHVFPVMAAGILVVGLASGFGAMFWGGAVSPRLVDRSLRKQLKHPALLPEPPLSG